MVIVQADTEFGTVEFLKAVRQRKWRAIVGMKNSRLLQDGRKLKDLPGKAKRGLQVDLHDLDYPLTVSWFWLKRADNKRELRFVGAIPLLLIRRTSSCDRCIVTGKIAVALQRCDNRFRLAFCQNKLNVATERTCFARCLLLASSSAFIVHWSNHRVRFSPYYFA